MVANLALRAIGRHDWKNDFVTAARAAFRALILIRQVRPDVFGRLPPEI